MKIFLMWPFQKCSFQNMFFFTGILSILSIFCIICKSNLSTNYFFKNLDLIKGPEFIRNSEMAEEKEKPKAKKKAILIMALYRGGSTLAGEFFNRNSDILYFFGKCFIISNL